MSECQITEHIPKNKGKNVEGKQFVLFAFHTFPCDTGREPKNMLSHKRLLLLLADKRKSAAYANTHMFGKQKSRGKGKR